MIKLDAAIEAVLTEYHLRTEAEARYAATLTEARRIQERDAFLLSVGKETAIFLNTLVKSAKAQTILEIGTSYGYSTIWLAEAARYTGGRVISLENNVEKAQFAQQQVEKAGLAAFVEIRVGDALETLNASEEQYDFVLLDIWKELYIPCFDLFYQKLKKGAFVIADNIVFPPISQPDMQLYRQHVRSKGTFDSVLLPIGSGIEISILT